MKQTLKDERNRPWTLVRPDYKIPGDAQRQIEEEFAGWYHKGEASIQEFIVLLPFYTWPMWLKKKRYVKYPTDYAFCVCVKCGKPLEAVGRLCVSFTVVVQTNHNYQIYWRPRISCCDSVLYGLSLYPVILCAEKAMKNAFAVAFATFENLDAPDTRRCFVCRGKLPCTHPICVHLRKQLTYRLTPEDYMHKLLLHFAEIKLDVVKVLARNTCEFRYCPCKTRFAPIYCTNCTRVRYCSRRCRAEDRKMHREFGCTPSVKIWEW